MYLPPQGKRDGLQALDAHSCTQGYEDDDEEEEPTDDQTVDGIVKVESMKELAFRIRERIRRGELITVEERKKGPWNLI